MAFDDASRRRMDDVYQKWEQNAPSRAPGRAGASATGASAPGKEAWERTFGKQPVRVNRFPAAEQSSRRGKSQRRSQAKPETALPSFTLKFSLMTAPPLLLTAVDSERLLCGRCCTNCTPLSRDRTYTDSVSTAGVKNTLEVKIDRGGLFARVAPYISAVRSRHARYDYPVIQKSVVSSPRVQGRIDECVDLYMERELGREAAAGQSNQATATLVRSKQEKRAKRLTMELASKVKMWLIRCSAWLLYRVFGSMFDGLHVHRGQIRMLKQSLEKDVPVVMLPIHRSHIDSLILHFVLFNLQLPVVRIAAGDNLNIPILRYLINNQGSFFIRRRLDSNAEFGEKDVLYRGVLQEYIEQLLKENQLVSFFLEGGRTRVGKPSMPKSGLLSIVVDAVIEGAVPDVYIVPVNISYDRTLESGLADEVMGRSKVKESLMLALKGLWAMFRRHCGLARIDFAQPFSLQEYLRSQDLGTVVSDTQPDVASQARRELVQNLGRHVVNDAVHASTVMATHMFSCLLLTRFREGVSWQRLVNNMEWLRGMLLLRDRLVGFSGDSDKAVSEACSILADCVTVEDNVESPELRIVKPTTSLPNILNLVYCSNQVISVFLLEAVLACSLHAIIFDQADYLQKNSSRLIIRQGELLEVGEELCHLLSNEFIFAAPCDGIHEALLVGLDRLKTFGLFQSNETAATRTARYQELTDWGATGLDSTDAYLNVKFTPAKRQWFCFLMSLLAPLLETYWLVASSLSALLEDSQEESDFVAVVQDYAKERAKKKLTRHPETAALGPIQNAVRLFLADGVLVRVDPDTGSNHIEVGNDYRSQEALDTFISKVNDFLP